MAKDPAFLFYPNDYIGGTMGMTFEEKGAYMELLMMQFNRGHMTTHMIGQTVGQLWDNLQDKFVKDEKGRWYNLRLEEEQFKRKAFTDSRRNNLEGINKHKKKVGHMSVHMENENRNEDLIKKRELIFKSEVANFKNYPAYMLKEFIDYWSEPNKSGSKMRFELEKTWDLKRRLERWSSNSKLKAPVTQKKKNSPNVERILNEDYKKYNVDIAGISENFKKVGDERHKKT